MALEDLLFLCLYEEDTRVAANTRATSYID